MNIENYNYWNDSRVVASLTGSCWKVVLTGYNSCVVEFTEVFVEAGLEDGNLPEDFSCRQEYSGTWQICSMCQGSGSVVNPSIDAGGITNFYDWEEDEQEAYFSGQYDICCPSCRGSGKNLVPNFPAKIQNLVTEFDTEEADYARLVASERMFGC
jgi:hypothetical protein